MLSPMSAGKGIPSHLPPTGCRLVLSPVMLNEAKISKPRPRPIFEVEAKAEAKDKNKKYQMLADNIQANLYHYDQHDTVYFSFSLAQ